MSMRARNRHRQYHGTGEGVALMAAAGLLLLAFGGGLYFLAVALNGWKG